MSRIIKITPEHLDEIRKDFEDTLHGAKIADGKISFTKTFGRIDRKAVVYFTEPAWLKMETLIQNFSSEVGWHGVALRGKDDTKDEYYITDILVYPQKVTGATVNTDQDKYEMWLMSHEDDVFNNIRMHGHSHVNMNTAPSSVDTTHQGKILEQLEDDMFYIFMIWNKRGEHTTKIYDLAKNVLFDGNDVSVKILSGNIGLNEFLKNAKDMVKDKIYTPTTTNTGYKSSSYNGYNSNYGNANTKCNSDKKDNNKSEPQMSNSDSNNSCKKRKGKRKGRCNPNNACDQNQLTLLNIDSYDYDDIDDPYGAFGYSGEGYWG